MADRYWVGGAGTWDASATTHWSASSGGASGASAPTASDNVIFDQAGTYSVTLTGALTCLNFIVSAGTVSFANGASPSMAIFGGVDFIAGTVWGTTAVTFKATTTGNYINAVNTTFGNLVFDGVGGEWILLNNLATSVSTNTTLTNGTLNLFGHNLSTGIFNSSNTNTRSIVFDGYIVLYQTLAGTTLNMAIVTGFSWTGSGGFQATMSSSRTFTFGTTGGSLTNAINLYLLSGASQALITTGGWFNTVDCGTTSGGIGTTNLNIVNFVNASATGTFTGVTLNAKGDGTIYSGISVGPIIINNPGYTTSMQNLATNRCTTLTVTAGTLFLDSNSILICSSTATLNGGSLNLQGQIQCTIFTVAGSSYTMDAGSIIPSTSFVITSGTFIYNGSAAGGISPPIFTHTAGTVEINSPLTIGATGTYTFTAGTLTVRGTLTVGIFNSNNANTRSLTFDGGDIVLAHTTLGTTVLTLANMTGLTLTTLAGGQFTSDMSVTRTFVAGTTGGNITNAPQLRITGGASLPTFTSNSWWSVLDLTSLATTGTLGASTQNLANLYLPNTGVGVFTSLTVNFVSTGSTSYNGRTSGPVNINSVTGTTSVNDTIQCTTCTLTSGTLSGSVTTTTTFVMTSGTYTGTVVSGTTFTMNGGTMTSFNITCTTFTLNGPSLNLDGNGSITPSVSFVLTTGTLIVNGGLGSVPTFTHTAGSVTFSSGYSLTTTGTYTFTAGTITFNPNSGLSTGIFSSNNTNTRSIAFGLPTKAENITLTHTTAGTVVLVMTQLGGFSWTGIGGFVLDDMNNTRTISVGNTSGGSLTTAPNVTFNGGASIATISSGGWFNNLNFGSTAFAIAATSLNITGDLILSASGTYTNLTATMLDTATATVTSNGKTVSALTVNGDGGVFSFTDGITVTNALTHTAGTIYAYGNITSLSYASSGPYYRSIIGTNTTYTITGAGATAWSLSSTGSVLFNGTTQYLSAPTNAIYNFGTGDFTFECWVYITAYGATSGFFTIGSEVAGRYYFGLQSGGQPWSNVFGGANYNWGTSSSVPLNAWTHVAWVNIGGTVSCYVNGISLGTQTFSGQVGNSGGVWIGANPAGGYLWAGYITNVRLCSVAVYTADFTVPTKPLTPTQSAGTNISAITSSQTALLLSTPNDANFLKDFSVINATITNTGTATANALAPFATTAIGITFSGFTISMTNAAAKTFAGGGVSYPILNQGALGALTIAGTNSFFNITNTVQPTTITFTSGTTQTCDNFNVQGIAGSLVTINSSTAASAATLTKSSGVVYGNYLSIQDSTATGGATWYASPSSTNVSNNTGWIFSQLFIVTLGNCSIRTGGITISNDPVVI